jgi:sulfatase modifying factor 1
MRGILILALCIAATAASAQAPGVFRDCADCPEMVAVPTGQFTMGVPAGEEEREGTPRDLRNRSTPQTPITINAAFAIGRTHVTRGQFAEFARATGHRSEGCYTLLAGNINPPFRLNPGHGWNLPDFEQTDQHPVVCISWNDAQAYVRWLAQRTGHAYRLPSEAEWEYAARAGTTTARFWGEGPQDVCRYANVGDLTASRILSWISPTLGDAPVCQDGYLFTAPAASFQPNQFGLYDMLGNAAQWVEDCWNENYAARPADQSARVSGDCANRVVRGGSWGDPPREVRAGSRYKLRSDLRFSFMGFRVARTMTP